MSDLKEDAVHRLMFDRQVALYGGNPLSAVAGALTDMSKANPPEGSLSKALAVLSNECAKGARQVDAAQQLAYWVDFILREGPDAIGPDQVMLMQRALDDAGRLGVSPVLTCGTAAESYGQEDRP